MDQRETLVLIGQAGVGWSPDMLDPRPLCSRHSYLLRCFRKDLERGGAIELKIPPHTHTYSK